MEQSDQQQPRMKDRSKKQKCGGETDGGKTSKDRVWGWQPEAALSDGVLTLKQHVSQQHEPNRTHHGTSQRVSCLIASLIWGCHLRWPSKTETASGRRSKRSSIRGDVEIYARIQRTQLGVRQPRVEHAAAAARRRQKGRVACTRFDERTRV